MDRPAIRLVMKDYDYLAPLACGDVITRGIDLTLERDTAMATDRTANDPEIAAGELSLARALRRFAEGDATFVAIPFFPYRGFRHRCFFVHRESGLRELRQLAGRAIGTNDWPATGNTWSRAALREQGVPIEAIRWWVSPTNRADADRPQGSLPPYVRIASPDQSLSDLLLSGVVDALMCPLPPPGFFEASSSIVRLYPNFREVEQEYYRRTGLYPIHHVLGLRREVFQRHPWVARELFCVLEESRVIWQRNRAEWAEATPWYQAEIEDVAALMGPNWHQNGLAANRTTVQALADEMYAQGLLSRPIDATAVFADYEQSPATS
jgi:4,5-dihydroxyphthalate decarboxylase